MWYMAAAWNLNPAMCCQIRGIVKNFIWSGKASNARAKVKWETLVLPTAQGGLGIIDPKVQSEALSKTLYQALNARWRAMERASEAQGQSSKAPGPRVRPLHAGYQLDVCCHETQKTSHLPMEEHSPRMDECEAGALQIRTDQLS